MEHTLAMIQKYPEIKGKLLKLFDKIILHALSYLYYGWKEDYVVLLIINLLLYFVVIVKVLGPKVGCPLEFVVNWFFLQ